MTAHDVRFLDHEGCVLATGRATDEGGYVGGTADWSVAPAPVLAIFAEFEEVVNGQMFAFLDEVQDKIRALGIAAAFDDGGVIELTDLQVFPSTGDFSFRLVPVPSTTV